MSLLKRLQELVENEKISLTYLEQKIGASKGVLSRAVKKNTDIQAKWLIEIVENYPQYNTEWLLTGKGEMLKEPERPKEQFSGTEKSLMDKLLESNDKLIKLQQQEIEQLKKEIESLKFEIHPQKNEDRRGLGKK